MPVITGHPRQGPSWDTGAAILAAPGLASGTRLALGALATWRLTHLVAREDGPADIVVRLRSRVGDGALGRLMDCFQCLSVWVAAPVALLVARERREMLLAWLALSGAACLLEHATSGPPLIAPLAETPEGDA